MRLNISKFKSLRPFCLVSFFLIFPVDAQHADMSVVTSQTAPAVNNQTKFYIDCALIDFKDIDSQALTKAELVQKMDLDFAENLNKSEKCMSEAIAAGAGRIGAAGTGISGSDGAANTPQSESANLTENKETEKIQTTNGQAKESAKDVYKHEGKQGMTAVCDTIKQGLSAASTDSEKKHFQALYTEYGCK